MIVDWGDVYQSWSPKWQWKELIFQKDNTGRFLTKIVFMHNDMASHKLSSTIQTSTFWSILKVFHECNNGLIFNQRMHDQFTLQFVFVVWLIHCPNPLLIVYLLLLFRCWFLRFWLLFFDLNRQDWNETELEIQRNERIKSDLVWTFVCLIIWRIGCGLLLERWVRVKNNIKLSSSNMK